MVRVCQCLVFASAAALMVLHAAAQCAPAPHGYFYSPVSADYVGGTALLDGPLPRPALSFLTGLFRPPQSGAGGKLVMSATGVEFYTRNLPGIAAGPGAMYLIQTESRCQRLDIPYERIVALARARKPPSDQAGDDLAYATAAAGAITAAVAGPTSGRSKAIWGAGTATALLVGYLAVIRGPDQGENYVAVFIKSATAKPIQKDQPFPQADLLMFRIPNYHDYYNLSMILSSRTGLEFADETATAGKDSGK